MAKNKKTKQERSLETRRRLLEATLVSLAENGYRETTTTEVVRLAEVSRGALAHHFPTKADLVAEAGAYLVNQRIDSTNRELEKIKDEKLETWLRVQWNAYEEWFPANLEFMVAARTDKELQRKFATAMENSTSRLVSEQFEHSPFNSDRVSLLTHYVVGCFIRGLCLERIVNNEVLADDIFDEFVRLLAPVLADNVAQSTNSESSGGG